MALITENICISLIVFLSIVTIWKEVKAVEHIETIIVNTPLGNVKGVKLQNKQTKNTVYEFRGIPFAKPPIGQLRFKKPVPVEKWENTLDATSFGAGCPQSLPEFLEVFKPPVMSENCLVLNVYVPLDLDLQSKKSVMVWIHGGALALGYAHQYDAGWIATAGNVIVVTINYRLDILGFLALGHPASKGNYGLWDQKLALQWVHDNIAAFGGNPESVTLFGESAGGWSTSYHSLIPSNKGLFQRAIAQSGVVSRTSMPNSKKITDNVKDLSNKTACPIDDMYKFVECLRDLTATDLLKTTDTFFSSMRGDRHFFEQIYLPVVDGELYKEHPYISLKDISSEVSMFFKSLDFMTGVTSNEGTFVTEVTPAFQDNYGFNVTEGVPFKALCEGMISPFVESYFENNLETKESICKFYRRENSPDDQSMNAANFMADIMFNVPAFEFLEFHESSSKGKTYQYVFSRPVGLNLSPSPPWLKGCGHGGELSYMFDVDTFLPGMNISGPSGDDKELSRRLIQYWTTFAKTGNPNGGEDTVQWKQYDNIQRLYIDFDVPITEKSHLKPETMHFWTKILQDIELQPSVVNNHDEL